jgi:tRNA threonylcarbamoyladenosine dehydratase
MSSFLPEIPIISVMGAAGKTDPQLVRIEPLTNTRDCMLAKAVRRYLIYSTERLLRPIAGVEPPVEDSGTYLGGRHRRPLPSLSTMPAIFGLVAAGYVIENLLEQ